MKSQQIWLPLRKSGVCHSCQGGETSYKAEESLAGSDKPDRWDAPKVHSKPEDFIDHVGANTGVHSGLMARTGTVTSHTGYARHHDITGDSRVKHGPYELVQHGITHLSGDKNVMSASINCEAMSASSRQNALNLAHHHEAKGGRLVWNCGRHTATGAHANNLADHFNVFAKSLRRGR